MAEPRTIGAVLFPRFELLDIFGPLEIFGVLKDHFRIVTLAETAEPVASDQGPRSVIDRTFAEPGDMDVLLVPGGIGTRKQANNPAILSFLRDTYPRLEYLAGICTGSGLLAASGLLNGRRATSNKLAFAWPREVGPDVLWVPEARLVGKDIATRVAQGTEYDWHRDAVWDPFARLAGLVD